MAKDKEKGKRKDVLKNPKGTRDWSGSDIVLLEDIIGVISKVFDNKGGKKLDTPVFELEELLMGEYGEDEKLIYKLQDQGGELLALRYDLTVPFARWLAMNPEVETYKRWAINKVYRRDQPAVAKGRMREFYQCDFDIAGACDPMVYDSRVIRIIIKVFEALEWSGRYTIKLNDRRILDGLFEVCGVPADKIRTISSAVDKLDKLPWEEVKMEMVEKKGLEEAVADKIKTYVTRKGGKDLLEELQKDEALLSNEKAKRGIDEMALLFDYISTGGALDKISFDLSLARGLDYYTGIIYEVVTEGSAPATADGTGVAQEAQKRGKKEKKTLDEDEDRSDDPSVGIGSVAAGGRYDNLVGRFRPNAQLPCVGISFGIDRIFSITKARIAKGETFSYVSKDRIDVYVMAFGGGGFDGMMRQRMEINEILEAAGLKSDYTPKRKPKPQIQFKLAERADAPVAVILGEDEQARGEVRVKRMGLPNGHPEKEGVLVKIDDMVREVREQLEKIDNTTEMVSR